MEKEINVLVVEPGKAPRPAKVEASMEAFAEVIGGTVETGCYLPQRVMLIRREAGPGTFLLCGFEGDSFISLTDAQIVEFQRHFTREGGDA